MLKSRSAETRRQAVEKLGAMEEARLAGTLAAMLKDPDASVRVAAAAALPGLRDSIVLRPLAGALTDPDPVVRETAAASLGRMDDIRSLEPLLAVLKDPHAGVRKQAVRSLEQLGWQPQNESHSSQKPGSLCGCGSLPVPALDEPPPEGKMNRLFEARKRVRQ